MAWYLFVWSLQVYLNGYRIYVDIMIGGKLSSIFIDNMGSIHWSVHPSSRREGSGKGVDRGVAVVFLAS